MTIETKWVQRKSGVYYAWRKAGNKRWNYKLTGHKIMPFVELVPRQDKSIIT